MRTFTYFMILSLFLLFTACSNKDNAPQKPAPKVGLHSAVVTGNLDVIKQHIEAGSDLNVLEPSRSSTPLHTAAVMGNAEAAKLLVDAGADINYQNADGSTALHTAAAFGKDNVAKLLIYSGAKLDIQNNDGASELHTAAFFGRVEQVEMLLKKGADKSLKNKMGQTALETVQGPFEQVKPVYDAIGAALGAMGLRLDYDKLQAARPQIAEMLK